MTCSCGCSPHPMWLQPPSHVRLQAMSLVTAYPEIVDLRLPDPALLPAAANWTDR